MVLERPAALRRAAVRSRAEQNVAEPSHRCRSTIKTVHILHNLNGVCYILNVPVNGIYHNRVKHHGNSPFRS